METGFFGKVFLAILTGFGVACLYTVYDTIVVGGDKALNEGYNTRSFSE